MSRVGVRAKRLSPNDSQMVRSQTQRVLRVGTQKGTNSTHINTTFNSNFNANTGSGVCLYE